MYRTASGCQCRMYLIVSECAIHYFQWTHRLVSGRTALLMDVLYHKWITFLDVSYCEWMYHSVNECTVL